MEGLGKDEDRGQEENQHMVDELAEGCAKGRRSQKMTTDMTEDNSITDRVVRGPEGEG